MTVMKCGRTRKTNRNLGIRKTRGSMKFMAFNSLGNAIFRVPIAHQDRSKY